MLLLPLWGLWALIQRGWRWCLRPANWSPLPGRPVGLCRDRAGARSGRRPGLGVARRLSARIAPIPGRGTRLARHEQGCSGLYSRRRLAWFLAAAVAGGLVYPAVVLDAEESKGHRRGRRGAGAGLPLLAAAAGRWPCSSFGVNPEWKSSGYGLMLLPLLFLIAGALLAIAGRRLLTCLRPPLAVWARPPRPGCQRGLDRRRFLVAGHGRGARDRPGLSTGLLTMSGQTASGRCRRHLPVPGRLFPSRPVRHLASPPIIKALPSKRMGGGSAAG